MATIRQPAPGKSSGALWPMLLALAVALVAGGAFALWRSSQADEVDPATGCLVRGEAPTAALFMVDITDKLSAANIKMIASSIVDRARALPRASRLSVVLFGDDTSSAFVPLDLSPCTRPNGEAARLDENARFLDEDYKKYQADLVSKIDAAIADAPPSHTSPITEQLLRAANSPSLHWQGAKRELTLFTDGLETGATTQSGHGFHLPAPGATVLGGSDVTFIEIGNKRDHKMQTHREREAWRGWLTAAGAAAVHMVAPGYAAAPATP